MSEKRDGARTRIYRHAALCALVWTGGLFAAPPSVSAQSEWKNVVVGNKQGDWRVMTVWRTPEIVNDEGQIEPLRAARDDRNPKPYDKRAIVKARSTDPPPSDWHKPDFEDRAWPKLKGPYGPTRGYLWQAGGPAELAIILLRGKFEVKDLDSCHDLSLFLEYHGGAVVYLNGTELKRAFLPAGPLKPDTLAERYPRGAYVTVDFEKPETARLRKLEIQFRKEQLKQGVNVVAVRIQRAPVSRIVALDKAPAWAHAQAWIANVRSGFGMTSREAAAPYDDMPERIDFADADLLNNQRGHWRVFTHWRRAQLVDDGGSLKPLLESFNKYRHKKPADCKPLRPYATPPPPTGWTDLAFDDSDWARARGTIGPRWGAGSIRGSGNPTECAVICARGKLHIDEPAACTDMEFAAEFHGGAVLYVNGKELERAFLPDGELAPDALATPYSRMAYVKPDGFLLNPRSDAGRFAKYIAAQRVRQIRAAVPPAMLRKGLNVFAVRVHRAPTHDVLVNGKYQNVGYRGIPGPWPQASLLRSVIRAADGTTPPAGVASNMRSSNRTTVWEHRIATPLFGSEHEDACEPRPRLRLVGARGGIYAGMLVAQCDESISDFKVTVSDLKHEDHLIPSAAIEVYYPRSEPPRKASWLGAGPFRTLSLTPREVVDPAKSGLALQPVWIRVRVAREAAPGTYAGRVGIRFKKGVPGINAIDAEPLDVPVELTVYDWTLPRPVHYVTFTDLIQSPESVALRYNVPLWSTEHMGYLAKSLRLLGELGNNTTYVRMINRSHFGDSETMVRYIRQPDGKHKPDVSVLDSYLDLVEKHQGKPKAVILYLWCRYTSQKKDPLVTEVDPKTGNTREIQVPAYCTPEGEAFWGGMLSQLIAHLKQRGYDKELMLGLTGDFTGIRKPGFDFFTKVAPGLPWVWQGHGGQTATFRVPNGYSTTVWNMRGPVDPVFGRKRGWQNKHVFCAFHREMARGGRSDPIDCHLKMEWNITGSQRGLGRLGADFWNVLKPGQKQARGRHTAGASLVNRWQSYGGWGQLVLRSGFLAPGKEGAIPTTLSECLREGIQEAEARIYIEKALVDKDLRARLRDDLAARAQSALDFRTRICANPHSRSTWYYGAGWFTRKHTLFGLAEEVARTLGTE